MVRTDQGAVRKRCSPDLRQCEKLYLRDEWAIKAVTAGRVEGDSNAKRANLSVQQMIKMATIEEESIYKSLLSLCTE